MDPNLVLASGSALRRNISLLRTRTKHHLPQSRGVREGYVLSLSVQWPSQEPIEEGATDHLFLAYFLGTIPTIHMAFYGRVPPFKDPEDLPLKCRWDFWVANFTNAPYRVVFCYHLWELWCRLISNAGFETRCVCSVTITFSILSVNNGKLPRRIRII